jgi:four helix bundle protein
MDHNDNLKARTKDFALRVVRLVRALPPSREGDVIGRQLLRAGTSVGANYRSACRACSTPEFVSRMAVVEEEADEAAYWMELLAETGIMEESRLSKLLDEAHQLVAIMVASIKTARDSE